MSLLEVRGLRVGYGKLPVLQGIDFDVDAGQTTVLLGLNGAGKTTTVSTLAGLLKPWDGEIRFDGSRIDGRSPATLVGIGIALVPEGRRIFPALTVAENLHLGSWTRRKRKSEIALARDRVFDYFPILAERRTQMAGTMSGGQQQMLAIGRALMSLPRLLLIDEASLGLSPLLAKQLFQIVDRINDDGVTVIIVEQNVGVLLHADSALVMEKGTSGRHLELEPRDEPAVGPVVRRLADHDDVVAGERERGVAVGTRRFGDRIGQAGDGVVELDELRLDARPVAPQRLHDDEGGAEHDERDPKRPTRQQVGDLALHEIDAGGAVPRQTDQQNADGDAQQPELTA
jgi:branched-chain amino acid transport system ATP-binding protein